MPCAFGQDYFDQRHKVYLDSIRSLQLKISNHVIKEDSRTM